MNVNFLRLDPDTHKKTKVTVTWCDLGNRITGEGMTMSGDKPILDACCGSRMFWFDKDNPLVEFMDIRDEEAVLSDGQLVIVHPNTIGDFTAMPYPDNSFKMVVFDPPHMVWAGDQSNIRKRYGVLDKDWKTELAMGFKKRFRVLEPYGTLIFKWNETQLKLKTILALTDEKPLFGHRGGRTIWVAFMKIPKTQ